MFQWGHDITVVETKSRQAKINSRLKGFNGATTLQSWKPIYGDIYEFIEDIVSMGPRHYSRGNEDVLNEIKPIRTVSMGPRHYSRGKINTAQLKLLKFLKV